MIKSKEKACPYSRKIKYAALLSLAFFSATSLASEPNAGPSFDCRKSSNILEETICNDEHLSALDRQMNALYKKNMESEDRRDSVRTSQKEWLRNRRAICKNRTTSSQIRACLASSYHERWKELFMLGGPALDIVEYTLSKGKSYDLCNKYVEFLNRVPFNSDSSCGVPYPFDATAKVEGLTDIQWELVVKEENMDALNFYWGMISNSTGEDWSTEVGRQKYYDFMGGVEQLSRAKLDLNFDGAQELVYRITKAESCDSSQYVHFIYDRSIPAKHFDRSKISRWLFSYEGRIYSFYGSQATNYLGVNEIYGSEYFLNEKYICEFKINIKD